MHKINVKLKVNKWERESRVLTSPLSAQQWLIRFNPKNSFYACYN